jgi:methyltransferase (TIGR00027 family)
VSDTALWIAACRAIETERPDALFRDPLADRLAGDRGRTIARTMHRGAATIWSVAIRTVVVDAFLTSAIDDGVDTVVSLGAGLDARPYRLDLPSSLRWIEVDYSTVVDTKNELLSNETSRCELERVGLDLAERDRLQRLLDRIASSSSRAIVLTEGVVPYLSLEAAANLADDLRAQASFALWVTDYFSPVLIRYQGKRPAMRNAPFLFDPPDWEVFFAEHGWRVRELRYLGEESIRLHRRMPMPWYVRIMRPFASNDRRREMLRMTGFGLLERSP